MRKIKFEEMNLKDKFEVKLEGNILNLMGKKNSYKIEFKECDIFPRCQFGEFDKGFNDFPISYPKFTIHRSKLEPGQITHVIDMDGYYGGESRIFNLKSRVVAYALEAYATVYEL
ncbi:MAG: hypothetical protein ACRCXT_02370 [Paraclostridium sp.]